MFALAIFVLVLLSIPVIGGSLFICAPKWFDKVIDPLVPSIPVSEAVTETWNAFWTKRRWYLAPIRWVYMVPVVLMMVVMLGGIGYWMSVMSFITRTCPYGVSNKDLVKWANTHWKVDVPDAATGIRDFLLGRL